MIVSAYAPVGVRNFKTHPLRKVKTPAQEFATFCKKLDVRNKAQDTWRAIHSKPSMADAQLLARLEAMPRPAWMRALADYQTHAQRMRAWFKELNSNAAPLTWNPISAERTKVLLKCTRKYCDNVPCEDKLHAPEWTSKRRQEVVRAALARGDAFNGGAPALDTLNGKAVSIDEA